MFKTVEYKNLIENLKDYVLIDVRSPKEYEDFTCLLYISDVAEQH